MSFFISPPPESIAKVLEKFRRDVSNNQFKISSHANDRMVTRGISQKELVECILKGSLGKGRVVPDYIGGRFYYKGMCAVVYSVYGDRSALPNVITCFREGDEDDYLVGDLPSVAKVKELETRLAEASKKTVALTDMSDDELEELLNKRRAEKADKERAERDRLVKQLTEKKAQLETRILAWQKELDEVEAQLAPLQPKLSLASFPPVRAPKVEPVYFLNGNINKRATEAKQHAADREAQRVAAQPMLAEAERLLQK